MDETAELDQPSAAATVDFDLYGVVGVRLINALAADVSALSRQLQVRPKPLRRDPDLVIHFQDQLDVAGLNYLSINDTAYKDEAFYLLNSRTGAIEAQVPFDDIGGQCVMTCVRGLDAVPLLADIVNMIFLSKDYVALHGSAFCLNDTGVLIVGWEKGGKTETLLSFVKHGARFVGDETILVSSDGSRMIGLPRPIAVWEWQFQYLDGLLPKVGIGQKIVFKCIKLLAALQARIGRSRLAGWRPFAVLNKAMPTLKRQLRIWYWPNELFAQGVCEQHVAPDTVFLVASHADSDLAVESCEMLEIIERMRSSNEFERSHFYQYYRAFKFAFPQRRNPFFERADERQATALHHALANKPAHRVTHPYPVSLDELYEAMRPYVRTEPV